MARKTASTKKNGAVAPNNDKDSKRKAATGGGAALDPAKAAHGMLRGLARSTSTVVHQAALILEEEIAAGIVAAKQVERSFNKLTKAPSHSGGKEIVQRFRRDAHDVVDIVMDLLTTAIGITENLSQPIVAARAPIKQDLSVAREPFGEPPLMLHFSQHTRPGGARVSQTVTIAHDATDTGTKVTFSSSDLHGGKGATISRRAVTFSPKTVLLTPGKDARVTIGLAIPSVTPPGDYTGLILAGSVLRAIITVTVLAS
jgi:hypothetical protein